MNRAQAAHSSDESHASAAALARSGNGFAVAVQARRDLNGPIAGLRVLLEGSRAAHGATFCDAALEEIGRIEDKAADLVAWSAPRSLRTVTCSFGEIIDSIQDGLVPTERRLCHFVAENEDVAMHTDARLLVDATTRAIRQALRRSTGGGEVMVHAHATDDQATLSLIDTLCGEGSDAAPTVIDALLIRDLARLEGSTSIHEAEGHRCTVLVVPTTFGGEIQ